MLTLFRPCRKTATGVTLTSLRCMPINETIRPGQEKVSLCHLPVHLGSDKGMTGQESHSGYERPGMAAFPFCNASLAKLCANLRAGTPEPLRSWIERTDTWGNEASLNAPQV
jgi:hypothetical protein